MASSTSSSFDYYHVWLGIPPEEQPPTHYRLLGIRPFESDGTVISNAADRQMSHVKTYQSGQHREFSQKLLNELSAARLCLLNADSKNEYDRQMSSIRAFTTDGQMMTYVAPLPYTIPSSAKVENEPSVRVEDKPSTGIAEAPFFDSIAPTEMFGTKPKSGKRRKSDSTNLMAVIFLVGLMATLIACVFMLSERNNSIVAIDNGNKSKATKPPIPAVGKKDTFTPPTKVQPIRPPKGNPGPRPQPRPPLRPLPSEPIASLPEPPVTNESKNNPPRPRPSDATEDDLQEDEQGPHPKPDFKPQVKLVSDPFPDGRKFDPVIFNTPKPDTSDKSNGLNTVVLKWSNGVMQAFITFIATESKLHGVSLGRYQNDQPMAYTTYFRGKKHGLLKVWDENGKPALFAQYTNGKRDNFLCLFEDGEPCMMIQFRDGTIKCVRLISGMNVISEFIPQGDHSARTEADKHSMGHERLEKLRGVDKFVDGVEEDFKEQVRRALLPGRQTMMESNRQRAAANEAAVRQGMNAEADNLWLPGAPIVLPPVFPGTLKK